MKDEVFQDDSEPGGPSRSALRQLVETALRKVASDYAVSRPRDADAWVERLCGALMSESETSHHAVISALMASGVSSVRFHQEFVPAAAKRLGELWLSDEATFVDVTVASTRLQALFRSAGDARGGAWRDRSIPLGQSILLVIPDFEQHSLGAFVAADHFRRHGVWVRMAIGLDADELAEVLRSNRLSMLALSLATWHSVEKSTNLISHLRKNVGGLPPIVVGGSVVTERAPVAKLSGADFAVKSVREAIERCGLATVSERLLPGSLN